MNKFIIVFLVIIFLLGQISPIMEYLKSKVTSKRRFENNALRHFNHLFIAILLFTASIWLFFTYSIENPLWLNIMIGITGLTFVVLSVITFSIYANYLMHHDISYMDYNSESNRLSINGQNIPRNAIREIRWHKIEKKHLFIIWSSFEYIDIYLVDGQRFIISSLLLNPKLLNKFLQSLPLTYFKSNFPAIKK